MPGLHRRNYIAYGCLYRLVSGRFTLATMSHGDDPKAFGRALHDVLERKGMSQTELAAEVGHVLGRKPISQPWVSEIRRGIKTPPPEVAMAMEKVLRVRPGQLTCHLGYVPVEATPAVSVVDAIEADPLLDERGRRSLAAAYQALVAP